MGGQYSTAPSEYHVIVQVPEHTNRRFHLFIHFEPTLWPEFISIRTPQIRVQVVPGQREGDGGSFGNGQFGVHPPGGTDNRFCER